MSIHHEPKASAAERRPGNHPGEIEEMAAQHANGLDSSADRAGGRRKGGRIRSFAAKNWRSVIAAAAENWPTIRTVLMAASFGGVGVAALLPVRHYELDQFKTEVSSKFDGNSKDIAELKTGLSETKADVKDIKNTTTEILFRLTPPAPALAVAPHVTKARKKAHVNPGSGFHLF